MVFEIEKTYENIAKHLSFTPLIRCKPLEARLGCGLYFKMENEQKTGSFKLRGALSKFSELKALEVDLSSVVAASTGNHALAVCHAAKAYDSKPIVFVPTSIAESKLKKLQDQGVEIHRQGSQSGETEQIAIDWAESQGIPLIHPYNDPSVIAGQGTIGVELVRQLDHFDKVFVPVGGGGLISGIAAFIKEARPDVSIIGVQPKNACEMADSIERGEIVAASTLHTISDGTAGGLDPETITYSYCKNLVDEFVLVEEQEIVDCLGLMDHHLHVQVEPAAALALAGLVKSKDRVAGQVCIAVVCGGNIDREAYSGIIDDLAE